MKTPELIASLVTDGKPVRPVSPPIVTAGIVTIATGVVLALDLALFQAGPRATALFLAWAAVGGLLCARAVHSALPGRRESRRLATLTGAACLALLALYARPLVTDPDAWDWGSAVSTSGRTCTIAFALLAVIPLVAFAYALRRLAPTDPRRTALRLGLAAGAMAALGLCAVCGNTSTFHALLWHGLPFLGLTLFSTLVLGRWLRW